MQSLRIKSLKDNKMDYLGEYEFRFKCLPINYNDTFGHRNFDYQNFPYKVGDRIGQIYLEEVIPMEFEIVKFLEPTTRDEGGFGSTGFNLKHKNKI